MGDVDDAPAWPDDVRRWLADLPPPEAPGSFVDAAAGARIAAAVRAAHAAGGAEGPQEVRTEVRRILRNQMAAALTAVPIFLEVTQAALRPPLRAAVWRQAARRRRSAATHER